MTHAKLSLRVGKLLSLWEKRLLPHWTVTYDIVPQKQLHGGADSWAASCILRGERALHTEVASDLPWGSPTYNLELTIVHEVVHAIVTECGVEATSNALREYAPALVWDGFHIAQEVLIDRIASELIRAYRQAK